MHKRFCCLLLAALIFALALCPAAGAVGPAVQSEAYIVVDADTGQVLLSSNADVRKNPASITKIMTMGLACEKAQGDWSEILTVDAEEVSSLGGSSHIALRPGEEVTLEDMLYAAEMVSANDAANVLAAYVGGSVEGGVQAMNEKAAALGLKNTHFANPHGLTNEDHYVSAADMAVILRWALEQPGFEKLFCNQETYVMQPNNLQSESRSFSQNDYIRIGAKKAYIASVTGSKTGYTEAARYTYACLAQQDGMRLLCVTLHSQLRNDKFNDVRTLLDYAFSNFAVVTVPGGESASVPVVGGGDALQGGLTFTAPAKRVLVAGEGGAARVTTRLELPERYVLGTPLRAFAVYAVDGAGVQDSVELRVPLTAEGLETVLAKNRGIALAASTDVEPVREPDHMPLLLAGVAGTFAALGLLLILRARRRR